MAVVDDLVGAGHVDFVSACSARLPMLTITEMLGVAPSEREAVAKANLTAAADIDQGWRDLGAYRAFLRAAAT